VRSIAKHGFVRAMSAVATFGQFGSVLGPLLGGVLVQFTSWRPIFLINVPVAIVGVWMNRRSVPEYRLARANRFDLPGFPRFATASALLLTTSELAGDTPVSQLRIGQFTMLAVLHGVLCVQHSRRIAFPVADLSLLKLRSVRVALAGGLFKRLGISGAFLLLELFLQVGCGWSPLMAGLMMVPQAPGSICAKWAINRVLVHFGYRRLLLGNTLIAAVLLAMFALLGTGTPVLGDHGADILLWRVRRPAVHRDEYADLPRPEHPACVDGGVEGLDHAIPRAELRYRAGQLADAGLAARACQCRLSGRIPLDRAAAGRDHGDREPHVRPSPILSSCVIGQPRRSAPFCRAHQAVTLEECVARCDQSHL
jgi:hypothetical protein